ncbi:MAG: hypothetical protein IJ678_01190 [Kiritimatiellae bacterium]|nr:hypothetical protein [Kiritimatiellia bacterium]
MKHMADTTFRERLPDYRNQYNRLKSKAAKGRFLDRIMAAFGYTRKFLIKRLSGNRPYGKRCGRGRTYGPGFEAMALELHRASGWMCAPYLKVQMSRLVSDWEQLHGSMDPEVRKQLLQAGESKFARLFRQYPALHVRYGNRASGANGVKSSVTACPGKRIEDGRPGVMQLDSVAHGGGGEEPFFWSLDIVDAETQWVEFAFVWCRGAETTVEGFRKMAARLPFPIRKLHPDGGGEFINSTFLLHVERAMPGTEVFRSRPSRPNDNCRVEQKNGSILRPWLRQWRLDDRSVQADLDWIAEKLALYVNLFVPSKKLLAKIPKEGKAVKYHYVYDTPKTPLERLHLAQPDNANLERLDRNLRMTNGIALRRQIERKISAVVRKTRKGAK